jgi:vacuolar-type H+-ATPase subunit H/small basic protein
MAGDAAGQITASLTLDISKFTKALGEAQAAVGKMQKTASQAASSGGGGDAAAKSAEKVSSAAEKQATKLKKLSLVFQNLKSDHKQNRVAQDQFLDGLIKIGHTAHTLAGRLDKTSTAYAKMNKLAGDAWSAGKKVEGAMAREEAAAKRTADAIVAESERKAKAQERATQRAVSAINKSIKASTKLVNQSKGRGSKKQIDPNVATMAIAQKNVAALNKEVGRGAITYAAAAQQLDILEKEIIQAGSGAQRGTEAFRQFQTSMESATGAKRFISNQQAMQRSANETAAALKGSSSKMGGIFKVMGAGMASSSRSMVMSLTNITEAFQKGQMGGRMLSTFLLGDLMDAMMIGSFATDGLVKSANALPASATAAKAAMMGVAKIFPIAMVGANLLAAGIGILVRKLSSSGKSAKEAKEEISKFDQQAKDTVLAVRHLERFAGDLALIFDGLKKSAKGTAKVIITVGENVSKLKDVKTFLSDIKKQQEEMSSKTAGEKIVLDAQKTLQGLREESEKARVTFETFTAQTLKLESQMSSYRARVASLERQIKSSTGHTMSGGMAVDAYKQKIEVLRDKMSVLGVTLLQHQEYLDGATSGYSSARLGAEKFAEGLSLIKQKAAELDKSDKDGEKESKREKLVARLIGQYQRLKKLLSASAGSMLEQDVEKAPKFAHQMAAILKIIKKYKSSVESASNFLQEKKDNEFLDAIEKNNEALEDFKQRAEEAKKRVRNLLKEAGGETTLKMGIGMTTKIGVMTPAQKLRQRLRTKDPEQEALLAKVRSFKTALTDLGLSSDLATKALNLVPVAVINMADALASFADEFAAGVGNMAMGNFGDTFKLAGKGVGMAAGAAMGVDPETAGKVGEALGAFSDMMIGKIDVTSAAGNQYNMGEVIQAAFDQPIKAVADAFMPLAEAAHLLASNFGGFLAQMITTFKPLISLVGNIFNIAFQLVANTLGSLMPAFVAIAVVVNPLAKMISSFLDVLMPIINVSLSLTMALAGILLPIMALVSPLGQLVLIAPLLTAVFFEVGKVLQEVATDIGKAFQWMFRGLAEALYGIEDMLIEMFGGEETFLSQAMRTLGNNMYDLGDNMANAANGAGAFGNGMDQTIRGLDEANALRDRENKASSKVLNAPQGFKVEKYRYEAMSPEQSNPFTGASLDGSGGMVINIEKIFVDDGTDLLDQLNDANQQGGLPGNGGF